MKITHFVEVTGLARQKRKQKRIQYNYKHKMRWTTKGVQQWKARIVAVEAHGKNWYYDLYNKKG